ncbi:hypothetical protein DPSP01_010398 [Paraphaeosphaeria sporulosa]
MHFSVLTAIASVAALCSAKAHHASSIHSGPFKVVKFDHPGALHSFADIERIRLRVKNKDEPWYAAYTHLSTSKLAQSTWKATPQTVLVRGPPDPSTNLTQNYGDAYRDAHSAYQLTLRWIVTNNVSFADAAVEILNAWGTTLKSINGSEDRFLAAGLYGYQFANAAELLRIYPGWLKEDQRAFSKMLTSVFASNNHLFLTEHNGKPDFYYANWDLCNIASLMAIGIYSDNSTMYNWAVNLFLNGLPDPSVVVNGALPYFSIANFTEEGSKKTLMEMQESGRDQGHATLCTALLGVIGQQGKNQGLDLYGAFGNQILNSAEYTAKFNTNHSVPYTPYRSWEGILPVVSEKSRFAVRPGFEAIVAHYADTRGLNASWSKAYRDYVNLNITAKVEGGGGDYGPNSGGFDAFGHGTLLYRISGE